MLTIGRFVVCLVMSTVATYGHAQLSFRTESNPQADAYVESRIKSGKEANLSSTFLRSKDRIVSADLIKRLIESSDSEGLVGNGRISIHGAIIHDPLRLSSYDVTHNVDLSGCEFRGSVDLSYSIFRGFLLLANCDFVGPTDFTKVRVDNTLDLSASSFLFPFNLKSASIDGDLLLNGSNFKSTSSPANISYAIVTHSIECSSTQFGGGATFWGTEALGSVSFDKVVVDSKSKFSMAHARVHGNLTFLNCKFENGIDLSYVACNNNLLMVQSNFEGSKTSLDLSSSVIGMDFSVVGCEIAGKFTFERSAAQGLILDSVNVKEFAAPYAQISRIARLRRLIVSDQMNLTGTRFSAISLEELKWPAKSEDGRYRTQLSGFSFERIDAKNPLELHRTLLKLLSDSVFHASAYEQIEHYWAAAGYQSFADEVFVDRRLRQARTEASVIGELLDYALFYVVGFGRYPQRSIYFIAGFLTMGSLLFRKKWMNLVESNNSYASLHYNAFWYSLDTLLPVVDLRMQKAWEPYGWKLYTYYVMHRIAGFVLVPVFLLSFTGIIH